MSSKRNWSQFLWTLVSAVTVLLSPLAPARAADLGRLSALFQANFHGSFYRENRCAENAETLIRAALKNGVDMSGAALIHIQNEGGSNFGLVEAFKARGQGPFIDRQSRGSERYAGKTNWGYHAFVLAEGHVLDFDFGNEPRVLPLYQYLNEMFYGPSDGAGGWQRKLTTFKVSVFRVRAINASAAYRVTQRELLENPLEMTLGGLLQAR